MRSACLEGEKRRLRRSVRAALAALPEPIRKEQDAALRARFLALPCLNHCKTILLFYGVHLEVETAPLLPLLAKMGKELVLPRCIPSERGGMEGRLVVSRSDLSVGSFGILEPLPGCPVVPREQIDLILTPALCYDRSGYRLGQGGGFYDRYLAGYSGITAGLCRACLLREALPRGPHDLSVSYVLTEEEFLCPGAPFS